MKSSYNNDPLRNQIIEEINKQELSAQQELSPAVISLDNHGEILSINSFAEGVLKKFSNYNPAVDKKIYDIIPTNHLRSFNDVLKIAFSGSFSQKYTLSLAQGGLLQFNFYPVLDKASTVTHLQVGLKIMPYDHTSTQRQHYENFQVYQSLFNNHPDAVYTFDLHGNFISSNVAAVKLGEFTKGESFPKQFFGFIPEEEREAVSVYFQNAARGEKQQYNTGFISARGTKKTIHVTNFPIISNSKIIGVFGIARDITESEKNKLKVRETQQRYKTILDQSLDVVCTVSREGEFKEVSAASLNTLGYSPEELVGKKFMDLVFPEDREMTQEIGEQLFAQGEIRSFSNRYIKKDGSVIPLIWSSKWVPEEKLIFCIAKDASDIKEAQKKILQERSMLKAIIENIPDYIYVVDKDNNTILTNKRFFSDYLGKTSEQETLGLKATDHFPEEEGMRIMEDNIRIMETGIPVLNRSEIVYDHKGFKNIISLTKVPFRTTGKEVKGLVGIAKNITESYNFEQEQKLIYNLVKSLGKSSSLKSALAKTIELIAEYLSFDMAEAWELGYDNSTLKKIAGFSRLITQDVEENSHFKKGEGLPGVTWDSRQVQIWRDIQQEARVKRKEAFKKHNFNLGVGVPVIYKEKVIAVLAFYGENPIQKEFDISGILGRVAVQISTDIKRKVTQNQLNNMFRFSPTLIAVIGLDGYLKKINPAFTKIFGYTEEELLNIPFMQFLHKDEKKYTYSRLTEVAEGRSPRTFQNRCLTKSGEWKWISWTPSELLEENGIVHLFGIDITPIKTANLELLKYKRIVESSKDGIGLFSLETKQFFLNNSFKEILGYSNSQIDQLNSIEDLYGNNKVSASIINTILSGDHWNGDVQLKIANDEIVDYRFSGGPVFNENNEMIAIFGLHTDISERKAHEAALQQYNNRINNILESITDGFFSLTPSGKVSYWNKTAEDLLGISRDKILGQNLWDHFPVAKNSVFQEKYEEALLTNQKVSFEEYVDPLKIWFEVNAYPGKEGLSVFFRDITESKTINEQVRIAKERYDLVAKATREAVYDWDILNNSLEWSEVYFSIYGFKQLDKHELLQQWKDHLHPEERDRVLEYMDNVLSSLNSQWECEYRLIKADKKIAVVLERGFIIRNNSGKAVRMIGALQDITELKQNEIVLEELNYKLQKHADELAISNAELEQFAYIASHDLQEPLRMVTSFLTQLQKKYEEQLDDRARQYIFFATDGAVRMRQIILDLLDYSRVGRLKYQFEPIDLNLMLQDILRLHENLILETNATIKFESLPVISAAATPLQRVLSNLITNSLKYSSKGVDPIVEIAVLEGMEYWEIKVTDNGLGINEAFYDKIFIIFQRLHSRDQYSGTGIGLAICKKIVENHGGRIWVNSKEGEGSTFHFTIKKVF